MRCVPDKVTVAWTTVLRGGYESSGVTYKSRWKSVVPVKEAETIRLVGAEGIRSVGPRSRRHTFGRTQRRSVSFGSFEEKK